MRKIFLKCVAFALALCAVSISGAPRAMAAVLPQNVLDAAFANAKSVHRVRIPNTTSTFPYYKLAGSNAQGFVDPDSLDYGYLANGADLLIVPLSSGGSGGAFSALLFTALRSRPALAGSLGSKDGHLDVHIEYGRLVVKTPVYRKTDPMCCPSAHHVVRYALEHGKLKKLDGFNVP